MRFGLTQLKRLREWRGWTQQELSEKASIKCITIQKHEQHATRDASLSVTVPLARALDVPIEALFSAEITDKLVSSSVIPTEDLAIQEAQTA